MKYVKMLSLLAVAAAAMMAFAATASAGTFTSPAGTTYTGEVHATAGETTLHGAATITCASSTVGGPITSHGSSVTGSGDVTALTFAECGSNHVTVKNAGTLEAHTDPTDPTGGTYAILTSTGAEVSIQVTSLGLTCVYTTSATEVGTMTTSAHQKATGEPETAVIHVDSTKIPRTGGSFFCGSSGEWTGTYTVTTPMYLDYH